MEGFNAAKAKSIAEPLFDDELHNVLDLIKQEAEKGKFVRHIYFRMYPSTVKQLIDRGFKVVDGTSICIQKDSLYHSIYWK